MRFALDGTFSYHVWQSFRPGKITAEEVNRLGVEFAERFAKGKHSFIVCTHIDKSHMHNVRPDSRLCSSFGGFCCVLGSITGSDGGIFLFDSPLLLPAEVGIG